MIFRPKIMVVILGHFVQSASGKGARICSIALRSQGNGIRAGSGRCRWLGMPELQVSKLLVNGDSVEICHDTETEIQK